MTAEEDTIVMDAVVGAVGPVRAADLPAGVLAGLVEAGLLVVVDGKVSPTRAAVHYAALLEYVRTH